MLLHCLYFKLEVTEDADNAETVVGDAGTLVEDDEDDKTLPEDDADDARDGEDAATVC